MGLSMGLLGALGGAADAAASDWNDQKKRDRDLNDYEQREKFAEQLQEQLMQKKMDLAQKYPSFTHFVTDNVTGDTRGYTPFGQVSTLSQGDPLQKQLFQATRDATVQSKLGQAAKDTAGVAVDQARAGSILDHMNNPGKYFKPTTPKAGQDKGLSPSAYKTMLGMNAQQIDPTAFAKLGDFILPGAAEAQAARQQDARNKAKAQMDHDGIHINYGGLAAPADSDEDDSNPFMNADSDDGSNFGNE